MRETLGRPKRSRKHRSIGRTLGATFPLLLGVLLLCCEEKYPLAPTFCDDWCRATLIPSCDTDPEDCVEECELTKASAACFSLQEELLSCYGRAPRDAFTCTGMGFGSEVRVSPGTCSTERDSLFECESPGIGQCLTACRLAQQTQLSQVELNDMGRVNFGRLREDPSAALSCPALDRPCEELCWSVFGLQSAGLASAGVASRVAEEGALECLQSALLGCFDGSSAPGSDGVQGNDAGVGPAPRGETIEEVIARCGGAIPFD